MRHLSRPRTLLRRAALLVSALSLPVAASAQARILDERPTIAVFDFENGSFPDNAAYQPLTKGMPRILASELARNTAIRVVDRYQIREIIAEQDLQKSDRVDQATAVRIGKILGARHLLMGSFTVDQKKNVRIDVYAVNTETSQWDYTQTIEGKADRILELVRELGDKVNAGLKLPAIPITGNRSGSASLGANQERISQLMGRAEEELDRGNVAYAQQLVKNVLELNKTYEPAITRLASLERMNK